MNMNDRMSNEIMKCEWLIMRLLSKLRVTTLNDVTIGILEWIYVYIHEWITIDYSFWSQYYV